MKRNNQMLVAVIAGVLLIGIGSAVFFFARSGETSEIVSTLPVVEDAVSAEVTSEPAEAEEQTAEPTQAETGEELEIPTPRAGLEASDPAAVNLASGEIQLVEVFAFW